MGLHLYPILVALLMFTPVAHATDALYRLNDDGHVLLLRHALAPGFGDPASFDVNDCATQRNLSAEGIIARVEADGELTALGRFRLD